MINVITRPQPSSAFSCHGAADLEATGGNAQLSAESSDPVLPDPGSPLWVFYASIFPTFPLNVEKPLIAAVTSDQMNRTLPMGEVSIEGILMTLSIFEGA